MKDLLFKVFLPLLAIYAADDKASDGSGLTPEQRASFETSSEKYEFQSQTNRLMDIIIHSLYSDRQIFLRELLSNSADATNKLRFLSLTNAGMLEEGETLNITIEANSAEKTLTVTDRGIGMTKAQLVSNLGTVAKSGTTEFLAAAEKADANQLNLIGQFGVGFYSVYLVADNVTVVSKNNDDPGQYIWESSAHGTFTVAPDPRGNTMKRGTSVILHLKEDAEEFLKEDEIKKIVERFSQFVTTPIFLRKTKEVEKEVPLEEEPKPAKTDDDLEISEEDTEEKKPATKKVKETVVEYEQLNKNQPIWTRNPKEVSEDEYKSFFDSFSKTGFGYLDKVHFFGGGEIDFKSLLYIPKKAEANAYNELFSLKKSGVQLYCRRVLIADQFEDFLPRYMNFVKGVVDSDDLPLTVSRETLSQAKTLPVMAKKIVRKILDLLKSMAEAGPDKKKDPKKDEVQEAQTEEAEPTPKSSSDYPAFWTEYGKSIKFGVIEDRKNKAKLVELLRFRSTTSDGKDISLESYVSRMKEGQKYIYYMTGETDEKIKSSPFLEKLTEKGFEVLLMSDPLDEYVVGTVTDYDGVELQSVSKENLKLGEEEKEAQKKDKETYKPLTDWFGKVFGDKVEKVVVSNRLGSSPCVLVTGQYGMSANMQRIVKGSTLQSHGENPMMSRKTLEVNVHHPIMQAINTKMTEDPDDNSIVDMANLLLDAALVSSGFSITDYAPFYQRMAKVVSAGLGLDPDAKVEEEVQDEPEPEEGDDKPRKEPKKKDRAAEMDEVEHEEL